MLNKLQSISLINLMYAWALQIVDVKEGDPCLADYYYDDHKSKRKKERHICIMKIVKRACSLGTRLKYHSVFLY